MVRTHSLPTRRYARDHPYATFVLEHEEILQYIGILALVTTFALFLALFVSPAFAQEDAFMEAKKLIDSGVDCNQLSEEELESIGDYYMERMHPGEYHQRLDELFGGEGSARLKWTHIQIALRHYCGDYYGDYSSPFSMPMMWNAYGYGMPMMGRWGGQIAFQNRTGPEYSCPRWWDW